MGTWYSENMQVSVILPCLNEEAGLAHAIHTIREVFAKERLAGEIIVVDNGSTDGSAQIAKRGGVIYVLEPRRGYGNAYRAGFERATGEYVIMGDPDGSYDFNDIPRFLKELRAADAVLGSRFKGRIVKGAMPFLHRYVGNPGLRFLLRLLHRVRVSEPSTGFIGIRRAALLRLPLKTSGMEFSSEMLVQMKLNGLSMTEIPIIYYPRTGVSKLRALRDGLRHVRYLCEAKLYRVFPRETYS